MKHHRLSLIFATIFALQAVSVADELPSVPPAPSAPRKVTFPEPQAKTLGNGLRVIVVERPELPLISVEMLVEGGAEIDPKGRAGLANITASLLAKGTKTRTAPQIAEAVEQLGASLDSGAEWDDSYLRLTTLSSQAEPALRIMADVVQNPVFTDEELQRLREQLLDELQVELGAPSNVARFATSKVVFGNTHYGHPALGLPPSLDKIKRDDVLKLYEAHYQPRHAVLVISGDITAAKGFKMVADVFGDWKGRKESPAKISKESSLEFKPRIVVIDMPTAGQAAVMLAKPGIARDSKEYYEGEVTNAVLGIGYSSRLNEEIRIKRGLSYGASSRLDERRETGPFITFAQTMNEAAGMVVTLMKQQVDGLSKNLVGDTELRTRKATLAGEFARSLETNAGFAHEAGKLALYGIPLDSVNSYISGVEAVTPDDVKSFATRHLQLDQMSVIVVGNASLFQKALTDQLKGAETIESSALDFDSPSLRLPAAKK